MITERVYEALFILDSDAYTRNQDEVSGQIAANIEQVGGEVLVSRVWEERRLAYPINGQKRGTYWLTYFKSDTSKLKELNRLFQISDTIVRFIFVRIPPKLVDPIVEHARSGGIVRTTEIAEPTPEVPVADIDEIVVDAKGL
ncbi:MAG: 30S ribosomal protein S6 [Planctomycetaceae bacterium]|nr:30S ribosomal protein S6 [Planctomycetaceae bacterium]